MTTNPYVNFHGSTPEQALIASLTAESIKMYGYDVSYIPRYLTNVDQLYNEDLASEYNGNFSVEMYLETVQGYMGDGQFLSNFGIEIRHQIIWNVAISTWEALVATLTGFTRDLTRPQEGDLIYWSKDNKIFQIKKVDQYSVFYQTGALQSYRLTCEMFEYGSEIINTGIPAIDELSDRISLSTTEQGSVIGGIPTFDLDFDLNNENIDAQVDNVEIDEVVDDLIDRSTDNPFIEKY